ncbi:hypothetical protein ARTSIC4J27_2168 [Pseudarthrobacter siccitolerans]|uniref:Uncharacterized protein n=1 Tax=Pseudarthrobacter siccitolerans TaxID=861266 RepID=A0A024H2G3_9MICC|nr:hypothetical protein ARTSIC4J27_2168 [Pseudarthrobacter siccitolerans]
MAGGPYLVVPYKCTTDREKAICPDDKHLPTDLFDWPAGHVRPN